MEKEFTIHRNGCTAHVRVTNFTPDVVETFNRELGRELWNAYVKRKEDEHELDKAN